MSRLRSLLTPVFIMGLLFTLAGPLPPVRAAGKTYYVSPSGSDRVSGTAPGSAFKTIQKAVDTAQAGDTVMLAEGVYLQDFVSKRSGAAGQPITITGPAGAVVKGGGNGRVVEIMHDYLTLQGFTIDGHYKSSESKSSYRDKLLYVMSRTAKDGVTGLRVLNMTFRNAGGECLRLRYFARENEIANSTFSNCGVYDFKFHDGGKNGEAIYIGTAPEQRGQNGAPTKDADASNRNWIHHNTIDTQGNECVDIKESSKFNIVEYNTCTGQKDDDSAGFDSRGNNNVFRYNVSYGNVGAGIRFGGDKSTDGVYNEAYGNEIRDNGSGGIKFQRAEQGPVCGNVMRNNSGGDAVGEYGSRFNPATPCGGGQPGATPTTMPQPTLTPPPQPTVTLPPPPTSTPAPVSGQFFVNPNGSDGNSGASPEAAFKTIQKALDVAGPGNTITLAEGVYLQDFVSRRSGAAGQPITITGPAGAVVKGGGNGRVIEIKHDYLTLNGFTVDGLFGTEGSASGYRDKLMYVMSDQPRDGVTGLRVLNMTFRNAGGECLRLRYFAQGNEVANSSFSNCGVYDFKFNGGGKNGEAIYIGTAPEQWGANGAPSGDPDQSNNNWIHHNTFNTQGNECVDIKEASSGNVIEYNSCTGQKDGNSAGLDSRGSGNIFRYNVTFGNTGAGIRFGGDTASDGINNEAYGNEIRDNKAGGIKFQRAPQGTVCGNVMSNNSGGDAVGSYGSQFNPTAACP